jgi:hypothetical protein
MLSGKASLAMVTSYSLRCYVMLSLSHVMAVDTKLLVHVSNVILFHSCVHMQFVSTVSYKIHRLHTLE